MTSLRSTYNCDFPAANVGNADVISPTVQQLYGTSAVKKFLTLRRLHPWAPAIGPKFQSPQAVSHHEDLMSRLRSFSQIE